MLPLTTFYKNVAFVWDYAQELFSPAGTSVSTSTVVFEYAIGDIIVGSEDNSNFQITQGFSQPRSSSGTAWTGAVNTDWNNPGNWSAGIPDSTDDIIISGGSNNPVINQTGAACKNLKKGLQKVYKWNKFYE